jgi:hypothetical protein
MTSGWNASNAALNWRFRAVETEDIHEIDTHPAAYRHGFALRGNLDRHQDRIATLLLIAALAMLVLWIIGLVGIARGLSRALQANTECRRRVLSTFFIGVRLFKQGLLLNLDEINQALTQLRRTILDNGADTAWFLWGSLRNCPWNFTETIPRAVAG